MDYCCKINYDSLVSNTPDLSLAVPDYFLTSPKRCDNKPLGLSTRSRDALHQSQLGWKPLTDKRQIARRSVLHGATWSGIHSNWSSAESIQVYSSCWHPPSSLMPPILMPISIIFSPELYLTGIPGQMEFDSNIHSCCSSHLYLPTAESSQCTPAETL